MDSQDQDTLPELGTVGSQALTIAQEKLYGDAYIRAIRASLPVVHDPVLENFINLLGHKLVSHAENVRLPFHFFLIRNPSINAAAFLGGYIKVHTGLFLYAQRESELAAVLAHEISHVTQRHIARSLENTAQNNHLTIASLLGSVILTIANPMAGIAAMQTSLAASIQGKINFTRQNEQEADRIGMQVLYRSGFDPNAMASFFSRLAAKYRYASKSPAMLVDHPLTPQRIADAQARASQYPHRYIAPNLDFQLAKARISVRFGTMDADQAYSQYEQQLKTKSYVLKDAALYGKALALFAQKHYHKSQAIISQLHDRHPQNMFILDTQSDLYLALKKNKKAVNMLTRAYARYPDNYVVIMNLAAAYQASKLYAKESKLLDLYLRDHHSSVLGWQTLTEAYQHQQLHGKAKASLAEYFALKGQYHQAIRELQRAEKLIANKLEKTRIEARIHQFEAAQKELDKLQNQY